MLHYGYRYAVIGNEHSANVGNLEWEDEEGRHVNHQWEKSHETFLAIIIPIIIYYIRGSLLQHSAAHS